MNRIRQNWIFAIAGLAVAVVLLLAAPRNLSAWQMGGSDHDAGEEEMLTGETNQTRQPQGGARGKAPVAPLKEIELTTRLDQTAVWVGDQFHYAIIVEHKPTVEFVLDNLNKDTINMDPLRVYNASYSVSELKSGNKRLFLDITLASFAVGEDKVQIPQLTLFFFRKDATTVSAEEKAAESLTVPGPIVGLRSTLTPDAADLRDAVTVNGWPRGRWVFAGMGWFALSILVLGVAWEGYGMFKASTGRTGPDPRKAMAAIQQRWNDYVPSDFSDPQKVMDFYGRSYQDVKAYVGHMIDVHTEGLTADEMKEELSSQSTESYLADKVGRVLGMCEDVRYGRNTNGSVGDPSGFVSDVRDILQAGR
ncbi:MAG: hypothetical protein EXQ56_01730 [Acidobacteria bacterium]|nr:hypothetical protein [Acidobacteriota bacterium]